MNSKITPHYRPRKGNSDLIKFFRDQRGLEAATEAHVFNIMKYALRLARKEGVDPILDVIKILDYANRLKEFYEEDISEYEDRLSEQLELKLPSGLETQLTKDEELLNGLATASFAHGVATGGSVDVVDINTNQVYATIEDLSDEEIERDVEAIIREGSTLTPGQASRHLKDIKNNVNIDPEFSKKIYGMVKVPRRSLTVSGCKITAELVISYVDGNGEVISSSALASIIDLMKLEDLRTKATIHPETKEPISVTTPYNSLGQTILAIISEHFKSNNPRKEELSFCEDLEVVVKTNQVGDRLDMVAELTLTSEEQAQYIREIFIEELAHRELERENSPR